MTPLQIFSRDSDCELIGEIQLWCDGVSVIEVVGLSLRDTEDRKISGMHFQTFFGGKCSYQVVKRPYILTFAL